MLAKKINDQISVGPQIELAEMQALSDAGFKSVILNRPNNEEDGQPSFAEEQEAAEAVGMVAQHIPMRPGHMTDDAIVAFAKAMDDLPKPIFAHCKSGLRSAMLWAFSQAHNGSEPKAILQAIKDAGYDMPGIEPHLTELSGKKA
ncbi:MAG: TIGR01244 family sulfur transferase [Alphaproteobacteria bacterium]